MNTKKKYIYFALSVLIPGMFFLGEWSMGVYGLDPPYFYFNAGLILKGLSVIIGFVLLVMIIIESFKSPDNVQ